MSHFDTTKRFLMVGVILLAGQIAIADQTHPKQNTNSEFSQRLVDLYGDKNRPLPQELSDRSKNLPINNKDLKLPKNIQGGPQDSVKMGGVSDGGGNAVGGTLFDFYENQGSLQISLTELLSLEPEIYRYLRMLDQHVRIWWSNKNAGFGTEMLETLKAKKVFLESKPIDSTACLNQSLVSSEGRSVVACQSDSELRVNAQWMKKTDMMNRTGLLLHEIILSWARHIGGEKSVIEQKVRELNRFIFSQKNSGNLIAPKVREIFELDVYTIDEINYINSYPQKYFQAQVQFCENPQIDLDSTFNIYTQNSLYDFILTKRFWRMKQLSEDVHTSGVAAVQGRISNFCKGHVLDKIKDIDPQKISLSRSCKNKLDNEVEIYGSYYGIPIIEEVLSLEKILKLMNWTLFGAFAECQGLEKGLDGKKLQHAVSYFRWKMREKGVVMSFLTGHKERVK